MKINRLLLGLAVAISAWSCSPKATDTGLDAGLELNYCN